MMAQAQRGMAKPARFRPGPSRMWPCAYISDMSGPVALTHLYRDKNKHRTNLLSERIGTCFRYGNWPLKDWLKG